MDFLAENNKCGQTLLDLIARYIGSIGYFSKKWFIHPSVISTGGIHRLQNYSDSKIWFRMFIQIRLEMIPQNMQTSLHKALFTLEHFSWNVMYSVDGIFTDFNYFKTFESLEHKLEQNEFLRWSAFYFLKTSKTS